MVHRYLLDDSSLISILLLLGIVVSAGGICVFFLAACTSEFLAAVNDVSLWVDTTVTQAESGTLGGVNITAHVGQLRQAVIGYVRSYDAAVQGTVYAAASQQFIKHIEGSGAERSNP